MDVVERAREMLGESPLCDHCLGRQFAMLLTGTTNDARGRAIKRTLGMQGHAELREGDPSLLEAIARTGEQLSLNVLEREDVSVEEETCELCGGLFRHLEGWASLVEEELDRYEFGNFLVGTRMPDDLLRREEEFWTRHGAPHAEPLKSELNREVGRRIEESTGVEADLEAPDVAILLKPEDQSVEVDSNPLYVYGRYRKLERGIPQTEWPCHVCDGEGCMRCDGTGYIYEESVEQLVEPPFLEATRGEEAVFHGCGREDVDALMLGSGRPFVLEVKEPVLRDLDLDEIERRVEESADGKAEVSDLQFVGPDAVEEIKTARPGKTYRVRITGELPEEKLKDALRRIKGRVVQRTPERVSHRRADREREREVKGAELLELDGDEAKVEIEGEAGLYVKELVHGDSGGTEPSLSGLLDADLECVALDVLNVGYTRERNGKEIERS